MINEEFNYHNLNDMTNFATRYIQDKGFTFVVHPTFTYEDSLGTELHISSTWRYNNVADIFVLYFGTREDIKDQLDSKINELINIRLTIEEFKRLIA